MVRIYPYDMERYGEWEGESGQSRCRSLAYSEEHIFVGLYTSPARVIQVNRSTMITEGLWEGEDAEDKCRALAYDGESVYAGLWTSPPVLGRALVLDGKAKYRAVQDKCAQIAKINPSDMSIVATWEGTETETNLQALMFDSLFLYVGLHTAPAGVIRMIMRDVFECMSLLQEALMWLARCSTGQPIYAFIVEHDIPIDWADLPDSTMAGWWSLKQTILINDGAKHLPANVIAPWIAHEGTHGMLHKCSSINQEYLAFQVQTQVWIEIKNGYTDDFLDYLIELFAQGEEAVKDALRQQSAYENLPEYCP